MPVADPVTGTNVPALPFLSKPRDSAVMHTEPGTTGGSPSVAHTITGHSVALRLTFGNVRLNLTGDLNRDAMDRMLERLSPDQRACEVRKAPHHGSADFDFGALRAMQPVVAIVSSGDESAAQEYLHPRATLMAALGHGMRGDTGLILVSELAAFFAVRNEAYTVARAGDSVWF